jgi:hypothetical protein
VAIVVLLLAPILLNTAAPLVRRLALEVAWVEELAMMVFVNAIKDLRVKIVPLLVN